MRDARQALAETLLAVGHRHPRHPRHGALARASSADLARPAESAVLLAVPACRPWKSPSAVHRGLPRNTVRLLLVLVVLCLAQNAVTVSLGGHQ